MADDESSPVTRLLIEAAEGRRGAMDRLLPVVYDQLRDIARRQRSRHRRYETLQTTALVHEAFLRLAGGGGGTWKDRNHFLASVSQVMRSVLVDYARRRQAAKRGGAQADLSLDEFHDLPEINADEVLGVHAALERLEAQDARTARVIELRYFVGLSVRETAEAMDLSPATVKRETAVARAWLKRELEGGS